MKEDANPGPEPMDKTAVLHEAFAAKRLQKLTDTDPTRAPFTKSSLDVGPALQVA